MKTISIMFTLVICLGTVNAQYILNSVYFTNSSTGYAVGTDWTFGSDVILKTTNAGSSWTVQKSGGSSILYSVHFPDSSTGYAVGEDWVYGGGIILKTTDGGNNWESQTNGIGSTFKSIYFIDSNTGYAVGSDFLLGNRIIKTTDGGITWEDQISGTNQKLNSVFFINLNIGYSVGENGIIIKTTNSGSFWEIQTSGTGAFLRSVYFTNPSIGYATGDDGTILKTTNGGSTWESQVSGISKILHSVFFTDSNTGYAVGESGSILQTSNSGSDWESYLSGTDAILSAVYFPDNSTGYIVSGEGTMLKTIDGGTTWSLSEIRTINVLSPNGGENWITNQFYEISWIAYSIADVKIELSIDNGISWSSIIDSTPNTGIYNWEANPSAASDECLIKISEVTDSIVNDISDAVFTISPPNITVTSPNGNEIWTNGSEYDITWASVHVTSNVRIKLSIDNGVTWSILSYAAPNTGIYSWLVNSPAPSTECLIRLENLPLTVYDESDTVFTISSASSVKQLSVEEIPSQLELDQNFPNPFNPITKIKYAIPRVTLNGVEGSFLTLKVYDVLGNEVATLVKEEKPTGSYEIEFDATSLPSGIYFYQLKTDSFVETKKMVLMK
jgi:photosystem II stability/assembly factor-like uncharacterized protein